MMGRWTSKMTDWVWSNFADDPVRILMLGLDNAGKTTLLYSLKLNEQAQVTPTVGYNIETINVGKGATIEVWDFRGHEDSRNSWRYFYRNSAGLLFVVDSSDRMRLETAREVMMRVLEADEMRGVPMVVMGNKQDLPEAYSSAELTDALRLNTLRNNAWHIHSTSAVNGEGVYECMFEMGRMAKEFKKKRGF